MFLDSAASGDVRSNASYLCFDPIQTLCFQHGETIIGNRSIAGDPLEILRQALGPPIDHAVESPLPFSGGAVGFFGYELGLALENIVSRHGDALSMPDMVVGIYDTVIGFDHNAERAWLMLNDRPGMDNSARAEKLNSSFGSPHSRSKLPELFWQPDFDREAYFARVERVLEYIRAGDIFQANFTLRHIADRPSDLDLAGLYLALRKASPAPFAAYVDCGAGISLLSASPERFLSLDIGGRIEARPIKGTQARHQDPAADQALAEELRHSVKDRAENLMIVDLLRNDIGRVAEIGSIEVPELCEVESFARVHHMVSSITGRLRLGLDAIDLLRATLPGGSVTGAPKIRAMQIIDELEACRRGPYCGAIAWIGFDGAMDSAIVIRTIIATPARLLVQAGGGIVADSDPAAEYAEMMLKAEPMLTLSNV